MDIDFSKSDQINSWPFQEARLIAKKINKKPEKGYVLFQSGYGASGLPHIGTFGEVSRTQMIMNAFSKISDIPTKLITFSDDYDALRKVPENLPNQKMLKENLGKPVSSIPDPFGKYQSFADNVNNKLKSFLDKNYYTLSCYSSSCCNTFGELSAANRLVAWFFVIFIFYP